MDHPLSQDEFHRVDIRVGTIVAAEVNASAKKPAYKLDLDMGPNLGMRTSSAQLTALYSPEALVGRQVLAVVNFAPRQIAKVLSEVLVLGLPDADGNVVLLHPDRPVPNGGRMY